MSKVKLLLILVVTLVMTAVLVTSGMAQEAKSAQKFAILSVRDVFNSYPDRQPFIDKYSDKEVEMQGNLSAIDSTFKALLKKQKSMPDANYKAAAEKLADQQKKAMDAYRKFAEEKKAATDAMQKEFNAALKEACAKVAKEKGVDFILDSFFVTYCVNEEAYDVTNLVIAEVKRIHGESSKTAPSADTAKTQKSPAPKASK